MAFERPAIALALLAATAAAVAAKEPDAVPKVAPPGVYGRVDVAKFPKPALVARTATIADARGSRGPASELFLWVPAAHRFEWRNYCERYSACTRRVYFVSDEWYYEEGPGKGLPSPDDAHKDHEH